VREVLLTILFFVGYCAYAQTPDCNAPITDNTNVLGSKKFDVNAAIISLASKGADPKVIVDDPSITPEQYVESARRSCSSWQSASGGVKNNLVVFLVFPKHHKMGVFVGNEFGKALNTSAIRSQFMAPAFKDGDWARGLISGINEAGVQIEAFQTSALHPGTTVVTQQPTDFSGLWKVLGWGVVTIFLIGVWGLVVYYRNRRRESIDAQQRAVQARNQAAEAVNSSSNDYVAEQFAKLSNSETFNPDTNGLSVGQYNSIAVRYDNLTRMASTAGTKVKTKSNHHAPKVDTTPETSPESTPPTEVVEHHHTTTVIHENYQPSYQPSYISTPIIIEEPVVYHDTYRSPEPSYTPPSSSWSDSSSSSDFGGSSSYSDSSSSSDFGGGGSDFGGGSSDF
jgi:uncharacterized membrane protein YgcG